jgi:hypothetical protein
MRTLTDFLPASLWSIGAAATGLYQHAVKHMTGSEGKDPEALTPAALVALGAALSAAVHAMVGCTWVSKAAIIGALAALDMIVWSGTERD